MQSIYVEHCIELWQSFGHNITAVAVRAANWINVSIKQRNSEF